MKRLDLLFEEILTKILKEGGHAFDNVGPILKDNINTTIDKLNKLIFEPLHITSDMWTAEIGSVGKKDQSGDIDLAMDFNKMKLLFDVETDNDVREILTNKLNECGIENRKVSVNLHMSFPICITSASVYVIPCFICSRKFFKNSIRINRSQPKRFSSSQS